MKPFPIETPFFESPPLSLQAGWSVRLKFEVGQLLRQDYATMVDEIARTGIHPETIVLSGGSGRRLPEKVGEKQDQATPNAR